MPARKIEVRDKFKPFLNRPKRQSIEEFFEISEWFLKQRKRVNMTQTQLARELGVPVRQIKTYEAVGRWSIVVKSFILRYRDRFVVSTITRHFASKHWDSEHDLIDAVRAYIDGDSNTRPRLETSWQKILSGLQPASLDALSGLAEFKFDASTCKASIVFKYDDHGKLCAALKSIVRSIERQHADRSSLAGPEGRENEGGVLIA